VNVQSMVFGTRDENSGTGVGFTRNPATGENKAYGDFLVNAQGEDVVLKETGKPFPQDPTDQLRGAVEAVFRSWNGARAVAYRNREKISHELGTAVNVQSMVFGNRDENSGTGVGFTRNPSTGENKPYGDFLVNAQGEDVVAGIRNTEPLDAMGKKFPKIYKELLDIFDRLEKHYRDMCDTEFTIEQGKLWMLQTRVGKRTGAAALFMAVDMTKQKGWKISKEEAIQRVTGDHLDSVLHPQFEAGAGPRGHHVELVPLDKHHRGLGDQLPARDLDLPRALAGWRGDARRERGAERQRGQRANSLIWWLDRERLLRDAGDVGHACRSSRLLNPNVPSTLNRPPGHPPSASSPVTRFVAVREGSGVY